jgi:hypothetical protein
MLWPNWVVPITESTCLHYVLFALFNLHITPGARRNLFRRLLAPCGGLGASGQLAE